MAEEFGEAYAGVLARDHWIASLGGTVQEALGSGARPQDVWQALCADLDVPRERWHGRGLTEPIEP